MSNGKFIVLEGVEGVGKTTNLVFIESWLRAKGTMLTVTREPGGTPLAENLRELLLHTYDEPIAEHTELLMIFAARAQHLHQKILPAIARNEWVLSDRFTDATYAYQGGGRGLSTDVIASLENIVQAAFRPDLVIVLDLPVSIGLARATQRSEPDRFEREHEVFFNRVRSVYMQRAEESPERYAIVDASVPLEKVQEQIVRILESFMARNSGD